MDRENTERKSGNGSAIRHWTLPLSGSHRTGSDYAILPKWKRHTGGGVRIELDEILRVVTMRRHDGPREFSPGNLACGVKQDPERTVFDDPGAAADSVSKNLLGRPMPAKATTAAPSSKPPTGTREASKTGTVSGRIAAVFPEMVPGPRYCLRAPAHLAEIPGVDQCITRPLPMPYALSMTTRDRSLNSCGFAIRRP